MKMKNFKPLLMIFVVLFLAVGCDKNQEGIASSGVSKDTMILGCYGEPQSMFPANDGKIPGVHVVIQIYETLLQMDKTGNLLPLLAERYEQIDDRTFRFFLKKGVKFHNGEEVKAKDVVFSFSHACENPKMASFSEPFDPVSFVAEDDYTVRIGTRQPFAMFLSIIAHPQMAIYNEKWFKETGDKIDREACGTGPFKFTEWNEGDNIILERFDDYHGEKAKLKYLNFRHIPEANSRLLELETGGIDLMTEVPGISLEQVASNQDLILWTTESVGLSFLALNFDQPLLKINNIRRAIAHAIDNDAMRKACLMEAAETAYGYLPPSVPGAKLDLPRYNHDVALSKRLLAEAGYSDGINLQLAFYQSSDNRRMGEVLQAMMKEANINLVLNEMETAVYTPFLNTRKQEAAITTLNNTLRDPHHTLSKLYSAACGVGGNRVNYNNPEMDKLLDAAASETSDWDKRMQMYDEIQTKLYEDTVWIPLYSLRVCTATTNKIRGFELVYPASYQKYASCYFVD
jgi:peptide/nickel transport system substrate-binding protein